MLRRTDQGILLQQTELRKSEAYLRTLTESLPDFIFVLDKDGTIQKVNRVPPGHRAEECRWSKGLKITMPPEYKDAFEKGTQASRRHRAAADL